MTLHRERLDDDDEPDRGAALLRLHQAALRLRPALRFRGREYRAGTAVVIVAGGTAGAWGSFLRACDAATFAEQRELLARADSLIGRVTTNEALRRGRERLRRLREPEEQPRRKVRLRL